MLEINLAMLFISTSGVLGRYISLDPKVTIAIRALLAVFFLGGYILIKKKSFLLYTRDRWSIALAGLLLGAHWIFYFYALQLSNVAIGMLSIFTYPAITALLEPLLLKTKFQKIHILLAILVLVGLYFLTPAIDLKNDTTLAILFGLISALCYALRNLIMKTKVQQYSGAVLMWYQIVVIALCLSPLVFWESKAVIIEQFPALVALALFTTTIGHTLFLSSFRHFSVTTASLISSIQPVYGILLGMLFLDEIPAAATLIGGVLILCSVLIESKRSLR